MGDVFNESEEPDLGEFLSLHIFQPCHLLLASQSTTSSLQYSPIRPLSPPAGVWFIVGGGVEGGIDGDFFLCGFFFSISTNQTNFE